MANAANNIDKEWAASLVGLRMQVPGFWWHSSWGEMLLTWRSVYWTTKTFEMITVAADSESVESTVATLWNRSILSSGVQWWRPKLERAHTTIEDCIIDCNVKVKVKVAVVIHKETVVVRKQKITWHGVWQGVCEWDTVCLSLQDQLGQGRCFINKISSIRW